MKKTAVVTGANGDLGSAFVRNLSWNGYEVIALVRDPSKPSSQELVQHPNVTLVKCDVENQDDTNHCIQSLKAKGIAIDLIVHAAGLFAWDKKLGGPKAATEALIKANVDTKKSVFKALNAYMHDEQKHMVCIPLSSHAADHPEWMDKEAGYVTAMQEVVRLGEEMASRFKAMHVIKPGQIDTEKNRQTFSKEEIGFEINWEEVPSPDEYVLGVLRDLNLIEHQLAA